MSAEEKRDNQITRNVGLYFVCYKLSKLGWKVLLEPKNTKGIDLTVFKSKENNNITKTVKVRALSKRDAVPLGKESDNFFADWLIVCQGVYEVPKCFILQKKEIMALRHTDTKQETGETSCWLEFRDYEKKEFEENWGRINNI